MRGRLGGLGRLRVGGLVVFLCLRLCLRVRIVVGGCIFRSNYRAWETWETWIEGMVKRLVSVSAARRVVSGLEVTGPGAPVYSKMCLVRLVVPERSRGIYLRCLRLTEW